MDLSSLSGLLSGDLSLGVDSASISSWFQMSMWLTVILTGFIIAWYIYRAVRKAKQRHEDDLKLRGYFDKYSEEVADKVIAKLKHENLVMVNPNSEPKQVLGVLPNQIIFSKNGVVEKKEDND